MSGVTCPGGHLGGSRRRARRRCRVRKRVGSNVGEDVRGGLLLVGRRKRLSGGASGSCVASWARGGLARSSLVSGRARPASAARCCLPRRGPWPVPVTLDTLIG